MSHMTPPTIERALVLSTGHLTPETTLRIGDNGEDIWPTLRREEGFLIFVPTDALEFQKAPADLMEVMRYAKELKVEWVLFDRDGPTVKQLPHYEW